MHTPPRFSMCTGSWEQGPKLRVARRSPGVVTYKGAIYAVGGMGSKKDLTSMERMCPITNKWKMMEDGMKHLSGWISAVLINKPVRLLENNN